MKTTCSSCRCSECVSVAAYPGNVPQSVQQGLGVRCQQLHIGLIVNTLLLKENEAPGKDI